MFSLRRARPALGTLVDIRLDAGSAAQAGALMRMAFAEVETIEAAFSAHRRDSEACQLSLYAHRSPMMPSEPMRSLLAIALKLYRDSAGIFDVAVGGKLAALGLLPSLQDDSSTSPAGERQREAGCSADIEWTADGRVHFRHPLRLDFGGIAKGFAIDRAVELLRRQGASGGCVNAGGDLRVFGDCEAPVALRFADGLRVVASIRDGAFAASRTNRETEDSRVWASAPGAHLDGRTREAVTNQDTVAVFAANATLADALTKLALNCAETAESVCLAYGAQWRSFPFDLARPAAAGTEQEGVTRDRSCLA